ncbi:MAG: sigma-70 family RNA polymerase sigma factor [Planctomycetota bacterium]|jgi:RNA polymerase sigma-70 factor (ECF subfamily)|nr:sigma-70 family RNA polymerase sigma factor [Planctomycetota bacterium]
MMSEDSNQPEDGTPLVNLEHAFGERIDHFRSYLNLMARLQLDRRLQGKLDSSDIVQQTMLQAHRAQNTFQGSSKKQLAAWLRQILARNIYHATRDFQRDKRDIRNERSLENAMDQSAARVEAWLQADQTSPDSKAVKNEQILLMANSLDRLEDAKRTAIELHYLQGWKLAEVAEHMNRSVSGVAGLVHRGLKQLRQFMESDGPPDHETAQQK